MKKKIITIGRQFGSGGHTVGMELAEKLGIPFYDKELVEKISEETDFSADFVDEALEDVPAASNYVYNFIGNDAYHLSVPAKLWAAEVNVIKKIAEEGPCVIVGRCADYLLKDRDDVLRVFIYADLDFRRKRIIERYNETEVSVDRAIREKERKRAAHYRYFTNQKWGRPENYDVLLNTAQLGIDECVRIITDLVKE